MWSTDFKWAWALIECSKVHWCALIKVRVQGSRGSALIRIKICAGMSGDAAERDTGQPVTDRHLRHVEKDVLITQMVRKKAHELCYEPYVRGGSRRSSVCSLA